MSVTRIRTYISRFKFPIIIVLVLFAYECSYIYTLPPLARELYFHKTFHGGLLIDATKVIGPHFQPGQPKAETFAYLERQGFKIYPVNTDQRQYGDIYKNTYTAVFPLRSSFWRIILTSYRADVYLQFDNKDQLVRSYGDVTMLHL